MRSLRERDVPDGVMCPADVMRAYARDRTHHITASTASTSLCAAQHHNELCSLHHLLWYSIENSLTASVRLFFVRNFNL